MTYTNCGHRAWICSPSRATAIAAAVITGAGTSIVRADLFVIVTVVVVVVVVAVSLSFNFLSTCISSIDVIMRIVTNCNVGNLDSKTGIEQPIFWLILQELGLN